MPAKNSVLLNLPSTFSLTHFAVAGSRIVAYLVMWVVTPPEVRPDDQAALADNSSIPRKPPTATANENESYTLSTGERGGEGAEATAHLC